MNTLVKVVFGIIGFLLLLVVIDAVMDRDYAVYDDGPDVVILNSGAPWWYYGWRPSYWSHSYTVNNYYNKTVINNRPVRTTTQRPPNKPAPGKPYTGVTTRLQPEPPKGAGKPGKPSVSPSKPPTKPSSRPSRPSSPGRRK